MKVQGSSFIWIMGRQCCVQCLYHARQFNVNRWDHIIPCAAFCTGPKISKDGLWELPHSNDDWRFLYPGENAKKYLLKPQTGIKWCQILFFHLFPNKKCGIKCQYMVLRYLFPNKWRWYQMSNGFVLPLSKHKMCYQVASNAQIFCLYLRLSCSHCGRDQIEEERGPDICPASSGVVTWTKKLYLTIPFLRTPWHERYIFTDRCSMKINDPCGLDFMGIESPASRTGSFLMGNIQPVRGFTSRFSKNHRLANFSKKT